MFFSVGDTKRLTRPNILDEKRLSRTIGSKVGILQNLSSKEMGSFILLPSNPIERDEIQMKSTSLLNS